MLNLVTYFLLGNALADLGRPCPPKRTNVIFGKFAKFKVDAFEFFDDKTELYLFTTLFTKPPASWFHSRSMIPLVLFHRSIPEAINGGMAPGSHSCWQLFREQLVTNSAIHKAAGLTVPGCSMILPGTIPETPISCEWSQWLEQPLGVVPTGKNAWPAAL